MDLKISDSTNRCGSGSGEEHGNLGVSNVDACFSGLLFILRSLGKTFPENKNVEMKLAILQLATHLDKMYTIFTINQEIINNRRNSALVLRVSHQERKQLGTHKRSLIDDLASTTFFKNLEFAKMISHVNASSDNYDFFVGVCVDTAANIEKTMKDVNISNIDRLMNTG